MMMMIIWLEVQYLPTWKTCRQGNALLLLFSFVNIAKEHVREILSEYVILTEKLKQIEEGQREGRALSLW